jgi:trimeric autotransporter adhesin
MTLSYNSIIGGSGGAISNDFSINVGSSGLTAVPLSTTFPAGSYICTSTLLDATLDIYLVNEDGTSAGYANATTSTTTITASKSFNKVVIYGATNNDTLSFQFKYVFSPQSNSSTDFLAVAPRIISVSDSDLQNQNDTTVVTGFNFANDVQVFFSGSGYSSTAAKSIVRSSSTSLIVTRPDNFPTSSSPYTITVSNPGIPSPTSSNVNMLSNAITAGNAPVWVTSSTLPNFVKSVSYSTTIQATDSSDSGSSIVYSVVSGALPTGITFNTSTATFSGTPTANSGTPYSYTIRATDSGGNYVDRTFTLSQVVPDAPTSVAGTDVGTSRAFNNGAVSVAFTAPSYTGTSPITSYTVTASTGQTASGSSSPIIVTGIATDATPTFTVTATNGSGTSLASSASSAVTVTTVPQAPTIGTATITNSTTVSLSFTAPSNSGGKAITSYTASTSPSLSVSTSSGTASPVSVTGSYAAGQGYTFTLVAVNANGSSASSLASNSVIPLVLPTVSGGSVTSDATYYYRTFTGNGTLSISNASLNMDILTVGGGGGGGQGGSEYIANNPSSGTYFRNRQGAGGGGAGGYDYRNSTYSPGSYSVTIGGGGGSSSNGSSSSFHTITSSGGFAGGGPDGPGGTSGSPGSRSGGSGASAGTTDGSGNFYVDKYTAGGGGGGSASVGSNAYGAGIGGSTATGGAGGSSTTHFGAARAGGGGGGGASGGAGGGGGGAGSGGSAGSSGGTATVNTGSGGGGGCGNGNTGNAPLGGSGGSGIVVVRYLKSAALS